MAGGLAAVEARRMLQEGRLGEEEEYIVVREGEYTAPCLVQVAVIVEQQCLNRGLRR